MNYALTRYTSNKLVDCLRGQTMVWPGTFYLALFYDDPEVSLTYEPTDSGYARVEIQSTLNNWRATDLTTGSVSNGYAGYTSNPATWTFPTPTASLSDPLTYWGLLDASTVRTGNVWFRGPLRTQRSWTLGALPIAFPAGSLHIGFPWRV